MPVFFGRPEPHPSKKHLYAILSRRNEHPPSGSLPCGILWFPHRSICVHPQKECTRMAKIRCGRAGCVQYFLAIRQNRREAAAPNRSPSPAVDFESTTSTNSITPAGTGHIIQETFSICKNKIPPQTGSVTEPAALSRAAGSGLPVSVLPFPETHHPIRADRTGG